MLLWRVAVVVEMELIRLKHLVAEVLVVIVHQRDLVSFQALLMLLLLVLVVQ
jgi:hypothetical protein